jgi:ferredoxin
MDSPFEVLALDPDADDDEIEEAYRERVKEAHPDHGGSVEEFRAVRTAYEQLKAGYRENGRSPGPSGRTPGPSSHSGYSGESDPAEQRDPERVASRVTYLNYDVLADFGWSADDADLFRKAAAADLDEVDYGRFRVPPGYSLLEAAEARGFEWPFACRGGACANCAILLRDGELSMPASHVLPADLMERGFRLSCNATPVSPRLEVLYNVKHMPELDDLLLPPQPFEQAYSD